jgi:uncharacterized protein YdhG (YjbR/CyaY superfamily)
MQRNASSPDEYRSMIEGEQREILESIRCAVFDVAPGAREELEHGMLSYPGIASLGAQKHYVSLYVMPKVLARHSARFKGVDAGKSCLRFRRLAQLDDARLRALLADVRDARAED